MRQGRYLSIPRIGKVRWNMKGLKRGKWNEPAVNCLVVPRDIRFRAVASHVLGRAGVVSD